MASRLTAVKGEEFIEKILDGERDFRRIRLEEGFDLSQHPHFNRLQNYIRKEAGLAIWALSEPEPRRPKEPNRLKESPINLSNSELRHLIAKGLYLPYTISFNTDFSHSDLSGVYTDQCLRETDLSYSNFRNAKFRDVNLSSSHLRCTRFRGADFEDSAIGGSRLYHTEFNNADLRNVRFYGSKFDGAVLRGADVEGASFEKAEFKGTDIRHIKNLERSEGLDSAVFQATKVTQKELDIIKNAPNRFILYG